MCARGKSSSKAAFSKDDACLAPRKRCAFTESKTSKKQRGMETEVGPSTKTTVTLLSNTSSLDEDENYSNDEVMLNEFTKLHPMCSMEATSVNTMQIIASVMHKIHIRIPELPCVPKSHDDLFLSRPVVSIGERECVCGERCLCKFIAAVRYGSDTKNGFVCKEYLLPEQLKVFLMGGGLPPQRQKCLVCTRYYMNYIYILARTDPNFRIPTSVALQTFTNTPSSSSDTKDLVSSPELLPEHDEVMRCVADMPENVSQVSCSDGYTPDAMLFVDENFAASRVQRESKMGVLSFRPVVRFCSGHYKYVQDTSGETRIVQVGIGQEDQLEGLGFRRPPPLTGMVEAAKPSKVAH